MGTHRRQPAGDPIGEPVPLALAAPRLGRAGERRGGHDPLGRVRAGAAATTSRSS